MRTGLALLLAWAASAVALAETAARQPVPVLFVLLDDFGVEDPNLGLIISWETDRLNKRSAEKVARFTRLLDDPDFPERARQALGCLGLAVPCDAPPAYRERAAFDAAVQASAGGFGYVVTLTTELSPGQLMFRGTLRRVRLANDVARTPIKVGNGYTAIYTTRAPAALADQDKADPGALTAWWDEGEPRRIVLHAHRGITELNALFALLLDEGRDSPVMPPAWESLTRVTDFPAKERIGCSSARVCRQTYVRRDNGDSLVLVLGGNTAGWFDAEAAAAKWGLFQYAASGIPGE